jgi:chitin synthase
MYVVTTPPNLLSTGFLNMGSNPFNEPSMKNLNPTDEDLFNALRIYLNTTDLLLVTKRFVSFLPAIWK